VEREARNHQGRQSEAQQPAIGWTAF